MGQDVFSGLYLIAVQQHHPPHDFAGADMEAYPGSMLERPGGVGEQCERGIEHIGGRKTSWGDENITALERRSFEPLEVDRGPLTGVRLFDGLIVHL